MPPVPPRLSAVHGHCRNHPLTPVQAALFAASLMLGASLSAAGVCQRRLPRRGHAHAGRAGSGRSGDTAATPDFMRGGARTDRDAKLSTRRDEASPSTGSGARCRTGRGRARMRSSGCTSRVRHPSRAQARGDTVPEEAVGAGDACRRGGAAPARSAGLPTSRQDAWHPNSSGITGARRRGDRMRRRKSITLLGQPCHVAVSGLALSSSSAMPAIGLLMPTLCPTRAGKRVRAFRQGPKSEGFVESVGVAIDLAGRAANPTSRRSWRPILFAASCRGPRCGVERPRRKKRPQ